MAKTWVLDTGTKGTGAHVVPLEEERAPEEAPRRRRPRPSPPAAPPRPKHAQRPRERRAAPLPEGHVRRKATGEIGRVQSVDPKAGTATVHWLKRGSSSTVPIREISRS